MKKFITPILIILVFAVLLIVKHFYFPSETSGRSSAPTPGGSKAGTTALPVDIMVVQPSKVINSIQTSGTVFANERVDLTAEGAGKVTGIYFKEGSTVKAGTLLVKLNDADIKAQLQKAKIGLQLAKDRESRQAKLLEIQGTSKEDYDISANQILSIQSEIDYFSTLVEKTEIRAPFSGVIGFKNIALGSYVNPAFVIATLQQINPIKIEFSVPEKYVRNIRVGETIEYTGDGFSGTKKAKVQIIDPQINLETRSLKVRAVGENTVGLLPGNFVKVNVAVSGVNDAIQIPTSAIVPILKGQKVYVMKNGKASESIIQLSDRDEKNVTVSEGLNPGDSLIISAIIILKDGMPVKAAKVN
ncbi:MAG: efflux RND transporter periplasmic adaptor subunit [Saprospiraceae bacterium]|nr:efflux RND transporter periplasmic adaptor subunit [Saprospiraceae bacterium]